YSPDGDRLVTGARDRTVRLWRLDRGVVTRVLEGHDADVRDVTFSPDGLLVASASSDGTVRLWNARTGAEQDVLRLHDGAVEGVAFSPDGQLLATGARDKTVRVYDLRAKTSRLLGEHEGRVYWLSFDPLSRWVAAPDSAGKVHLWGLGEDAEHRVIHGHRNEVNSVDFTPDGRVMVTGSDDGTVRTWDPVTGRARWRAPVLGGDPPRLFSHLGWTNLRGGETTPPPMWSKALVAAIEARADQVVVGESVCLRAGAELELWKPLAEAPTARETIDGLAMIVPTASGCAALGNEAVWRSSGEQLVAMDVPRASAVGPGHGDAGLLVATSDAVLVFDAEGKRLREHPAGPGIVALASDGAGIVVGYRDGHVERLGDQEARPFEETPNAVPTIIAPGPGGVLFVGYGDGTVAMWQGDGGARLATARLHGAIHHLLQHGRQLLVASDLGQSLVWELEPFHRERCELLRTVWDQVPVVWEGGRALARGVPERHPCRP
ncbi:MAG: WD40 repeat domain-containing protein, partial [Polyangiaceae bacterium]